MSDVIAIERGIIRHRERARQVVDFSGLRFGNITPTDVDGLIEFRNRCFLFIELKHVVKPTLDAGQRMALERLADDLRKPTLVLVALHDTRADEDIDAAEAFLHAYYWLGQWRKPRAVISVREAAEGFFTKQSTPG